MQEREILEDTKFGESENKLINISRKGSHVVDRDCI